MLLLPVLSPSPSSSFFNHQQSSSFVSVSKTKESSFSPTHSSSLMFLPRIPSSRCSLDFLIGRSFLPLHKLSLFWALPPSPRFILQHFCCCPTFPSTLFCVAHQGISLCNDTRLLVCLLQHEQHASPLKQASLQCVWLCSLSVGFMLVHSECATSPAVVCLHINFFAMASNQLFMCKNIGVLLTHFQPCTRSRSHNPKITTTSSSRLLATDTQQISEICG